MSKPVAASYCVTFLAPEMLHVYRQITGLQQFQPHVLTQKRLHEDRFPMDPARITTVPKSPARALRRLWFKQVRRGPIPVSRGQADAVGEALQACEASLLHVYFGHIGLYLLPVLRRRLVPAVVSFHGADAGVELDRAPYRIAMRELFEVTDRILVRSLALGRELEEIGCLPQKIRLNRTGIPVDEWAPVERSRPADGAWHFFQACRLIEKKGLDLTLRAFAAFRKAQATPAARLEIAGEGPLLEPLQALARELKVEDAVRFPGFLSQDELRAAVGRSHIFFHPSRTASDGNQEGVPNSMLEAMATGLPVIATEHGGIPEAVQHGVSGLLVAENDLNGLKRELAKLTGDASLYERLCRGAREAVVARFSREAQIQNLEAIYQEVLDETPDPMLLTPPAAAARNRDPGDEA